MRALCGVQLIDRKRAKNFMLMLGLKKTMDQLAGYCKQCVWLCVGNGGWLCLETGVGV